MPTPAWLGRFSGAATAILLLAMLPIAASAQTPAGTPIDNQATARYALGATPGITDLSNLHTLVVAALQTPATVEFLQHAPGAPGAQSVDVPPSQCSSSGLPAGPFNPVPPPTRLDGTPIALPGPVELLPASEYTRGAPVFLRLTDGDQDLDPALVGTVLVRITGAADSELVELSETGVSTGVFTGHIQSAGGAVAANDCTLQAAENETIGVSYADPTDAADTANAAALISPLSLAFDAASGAALSGITITLIDDTTGLPALVLGDDGVSVFPSTVPTGGTVTDGVKVYVFAPGSYRFPQVPAGTYRLDVVPIAGYLAPSAVPDAQLQTLPGAPWALSLASRGQPFVLAAAGAIAIDVPLDAATSQVFLVKTASTEAVGVGEFLQYNIRVRNPGVVDAPLGLELRDVLPLGFRYQSGSARLDDAVFADPAVSSDGRTLTFTLAPTALAQFQDLRYVLEVTAGTPLGDASNRARSLVIGGTESHQASATVLVRDDLFTSTTLLVGHVSKGACGDPPAPGGLAGARVYLEDGSYAVTDEQGYFQFEGVRPGNHVVQLDMDTLPVIYQPVPCVQNTRFAGRSFSQFVDLQAGTMWRTDFRVAKKPPAAGYVNAQLHARSEDGRLDYRLDVRGSTVPVRDLRVLAMLPEGTSYIPGSSSLDDTAIADPEVSGTLLTFVLADQDARWMHDLRFSARSRAGPGERLLARAFAMFRTPTESAVRTPVVETVLLESSTAASGVSLVETTGLRPGEIWDDGAAEPAEAPAPAEPAYDAAWLAQAEPGLAWLTPAPGHAPEIPSLDIAIKHDAAHEIVLMRNDREVSALNLTGLKKDATRGVGMTTWGGVDLDEGTNTFVARALDAGGAVAETIEYRVHYAGPPVHAEIVPEASQLVADGKLPVVVAVRLRDRWNMPARKGVIVEFELDPPYQPLRDRELERSRGDVNLGAARPVAEVGPDGIARFEIEPTSQTGELELRLNLSDRRHELSTWLEPEQRDWILVGIAEGTAGYNHVSGNMQALDDLDVEEHGETTERFSLFAKGRVKGKWLLTMAYDSRAKDKSQGEGLGQLIDPDRFYTLYGSKSEQRYDAQTSSKLYLKLERHQFYAMFGDYETGFEVTELARYSRSFTGLKSEFKGDRLSFNAFATNTDQGFIRDEIRGDGTTGLYQLTRADVLVNSETIVIETRDRFKTEVVLNAQTMTRHVDYNIDYARGAMYFKDPIPSKDSGFNPIFIVAEYEADDDKDESVIAGGRGALHFMDDRVELGATTIHEGNTGMAGDLVGGDLRLDLTDTTRFRAEYASTRTDERDLDQQGRAYLAELTTTGERLKGRAYLREQEQEFGLGNQAQTEQGTRKFGLESSYSLADDVTLLAEAFRQTNLETGLDRDVVEARANLRHQDLALFTGYRLARDDGETGDDQVSQQLLAGGSMAVLDDRLRLRLTGELDVGGDDANSDYPTRLILGADYELMDDVELFAEQEFSFGEARDTRATRIGFRAKPWSGATASTSIEERLTESGPRTFLNMGLAQTWQVNDRWGVDGSLDHSQTHGDAVSGFSSNIPPTSGSDEDFTAISLGSVYRAERWEWTGRLESRFGDSEDKWGFLTGFVREIDNGVGYSLSMQYYDTEGQTDDRTEADARLSLAYRPVHGRWIVLNRLDFLYERRDGSAFSFDNRKVVNNMNLNYQWSPGLQISLQYGAKYVLDKVDDVDYDGYIDIWGIELRRDLGKKWDVGLSARFRNSWDADVLEKSYGIEVGHQLKTNLWLSVGYNFSGFEDDDLSGADYSREGPYLKFRYKFDQQTIRDLLRPR